MDTFVSKLHIFLIFLTFFFYLCQASSSLEEFIQCLSISESFGIGQSNSSMTLKPHNFLLDSNELLCSNPSNAPPSIYKYIYTQQNPGSYYSTLYAYIKNSRFNRTTTPKPLAIVTAMHYSHVQSTVVCAKSTGLRIRIRSGGHDFEGMSYVANEPFILLDMFGLRDIEVDIGSHTAWVQAGATVGELYYTIARESRGLLGFPAGVCPTVGLGGHFGGAGYGAMIRKYGMTVDHIIDAQIVDANGRILGRETMGEDLFWAIRGGGAASFCVVLSWKINLVHVPQTVTTFSVQRTLEERLTDIIEQWQEVAPKLDPELFIRAVPIVVSTRTKNSYKKTVEVQFIALYLGDARKLFHVVDKWFPLLRLQESDMEEMSWAESTLFWNELPVSTTPLEVLLERTITSNSYNKRRSDYVKEPIPREGLELLWKKLIEVENISMQWNPYGGRMNEIDENATPFPHRAGNLFKMQYHTVWQEYEEDMEDEVERSYQKATDELYATLTPYVSKAPRAGFLNYRDLKLGSKEHGSLMFALEAYFKGNVERLLRVKAEVDPENFFRDEQSIPVVESYIETY